MKKADTRPGVPAFPFSRRRASMVVGMVMALTVSLVAMALLVGRQTFRFPADELRARRPSRLFTDRHGRVLRAELGDGDCWQIPVPLREVSPYLVNATLAVEDKRFWAHRGVDWAAACRALVSNVRSRRTVSGASTISMQLARLTRPEPRSLAMKVRQVFRALDLEREWDKCRILGQYLNAAPYGGNLVGIEAAALYYFGKPAHALTFAEATLLAGVPQRPSALRPDRHPEAARKRQEHVISCLERNGHRGAAVNERRQVSVLTPQAGRQPHSAVRPLHPAMATEHGGIAALRTNKLGLPMAEEHFCLLAAMDAPAGWVRTSLDPMLQSLGRATLQTQVRKLNGVSDGAVVVIENRTAAVRALIGTVDFEAPEGGQVNGACMRRSPGSALKPFIYLLALEGGLIVPNTRLRDSPLTYHDYRPENFDGTFRDSISAREALARSLNTPAVRMLERVGGERLLRALETCGIRTLDRGADAYGLALALGGGEVTLLQLTNAYAGLARGGCFAPCRFIELTSAGRQAEEGVRPFASGSVALLVDMLSTYRLPGCPNIELAWKTGTSNGFRDAWCVAFNQEYTVGVWLGNKSGHPAPALVGLGAAGPVVAGVFQGIYRRHSSPSVQSDPDGTRTDVLCSHSGLRVGPYCREGVAGKAVTGIPLRQCESCFGEATSADGDTPSAGSRGPVRAGKDGTASLPPRGGGRARIVSPESTVYAALGPDGVVLQVASFPERDVLWFVDGEYVGRHAGAFTRTFLPGAHEVRCTDPGSAVTDIVRLSVTVPRHPGSRGGGGSF